jgi:hypothetical protein
MYDRRLALEECNGILGGEMAGKVEEAKEAVRAFIFG